MEFVPLVKCAISVRALIGDDKNVVGHGCSLIGLSADKTFAWYLAHHAENLFKVSVFPNGSISRQRLTLTEFNHHLLVLVPFGAELFEHRYGASSVKR